jgi:hypothetical protein
MEMKEWQVRKICKLSEEQFLELQAKEGNTLDKYVDFIMDIIKTALTISNSNIYYKLLEAFPNCPAG